MSVTTVYLQKCEVTDPSVWAEATGDVVQVGDPEWRLLDDPDLPIASADFLRKEDALSWARDMGFNVVYVLPRRN